MAQREFEGVVAQGLRPGAAAAAWRSNALGRACITSTVNTVGVRRTAGTQSQSRAAEATAARRRQPMASSWWFLSDGGMMRKVVHRSAKSCRE